MQIEFLVQNGCVPPLLNLLTKPDTRIVSVVLEGILNILKCGQRNVKGDGSNPYVTVVEMCEGVNRIEELESHENQEIRDLVVKVRQLLLG